MGTFTARSEPGEIQTEVDALRGRSARHDDGQEKVHIPYCVKKKKEKKSVLVKVKVLFSLVDTSMIGCRFFCFCFFF